MGNAVEPGFIMQMSLFSFTFMWKMDPTLLTGIKSAAFTTAAPSQEPPTAGSHVFRVLAPTHHWEETARAMWGGSPPK